MVFLLFNGQWREGGGGGRGMRRGWIYVWTRISSPIVPFNPYTATKSSFTLLEITIGQDKIYGWSTHSALGPCWCPQRDTCPTVLHQNPSPPDNHLKWVGGGGAGEGVFEMCVSKNSYSFCGGGGENSRGGHCFSEKDFETLADSLNNMAWSLKKIFQMTFCTFLPSPSNWRLREFFTGEIHFLLPVRYQKWPCFQKTQFGTVKCMPRFWNKCENKILLNLNFFRVSPCGSCVSS